MEMEIYEEEATQKQKRMEGGDSPDPKRTKVVDKIQEEEEEIPAMLDVTGDDDCVSVMSEDSDIEVKEEDSDIEVKEEDGLWVRPPLTEEELAEKKKQDEEHKVWMDVHSKHLIKYYGTDDSETIYWIIEEKRAEYDAEYPLELDEDEEKEEELEMDEKQRVNKILKDVEDRTRPISHTPRTHHLLPQVDCFLLAPWVDEDCTRRNQFGKARTLSMYYKRFCPAAAVESACDIVGPYSWNRLPEVDAEYLSLYSKLCDLVEQDHKSWFLLLKSSVTLRIHYDAKAQEMAKELNLQRLKEADIFECLQNVFKEGDTIAEHKLKAEYDMHLLACEFDPKLRRRDFKPKEPTPVIDSIVCFHAARQQQKFDMWMEEKKALNWTKDQCREELNALHAKNLRQYCGTRIRYVKYKRAWAKNLGIISE